MARSTRRSGSTSASITNTASARTRGEGNWYWDRRRRQGRARRRPNTNTRRPAPASSSRVEGQHGGHHAPRRIARPCSSSSAPAPASTSPPSARPARSSPAAAAPAARSPSCKVYDQVANVVKSGGKTRRAAKMNTLKDWHPDIEEFIEAKTKEEKKAWALIEQGYDGSYNGDAYGSVMYPEREPLRARQRRVHAGRRRRTANGGPAASPTANRCEKKDARELLRKIAEGTWICGDPGMQFDATIHNWHTCKGSGRQNSTNPCSEYLFLNNTACNLASLNLMKFKRRGRHASTSSASRPPCASSSPRRKSSSTTPAIPPRRSRKTPTSSARSASATPTSARSS